MKKLIIGSGLALGLLFTSFTFSNSTEQIQEKTSVGCHYGQCQATAATKVAEITTNFHTVANLY